MTDTRRNRAITATLMASSVLIVISGCASPKESLIESTDERCDTISQRFIGELSYGESVGADDLNKMRKRNSLIEDLQDHVREQPQPESGQDELEGWLSALDTVVEETETMHEMYQDARYGDGLALSLHLNIVDGAVEDAGDAAKRFGFQSCARVEQWKTFPK